MYSLVLIALLPYILCQLNSTLHFSDLQHGRALWIVDEVNLPWSGSYEFLSLRSLSQTILLTVIDSSSGTKIGECSEVSNKAPQWTLFQWLLKADGISCSVSSTNASFVPFPLSTGQRTFSVRVDASHGPVCMRNLQVQNEHSIGCPPHMTSSFMSSRFLNCSCPFEEENQTFVANDSSSRLFELAMTDPPSQMPDLSLWTMPTVNPCGEYNCLHNGTCVVTQEGLATCICQDGFTGPTCEIDVCSSVRCQNGGWCRRSKEGAHCECPHGFTGILCESAVVSCEPPCMNGKCIVENETTRCECEQGFIGKTCNVVDICLRDAPCAVFGDKARCVSNRLSFITTSSILNNVTYECQCEHPISREIVNCLAMHLSSVTSESFPVTSSTWVPSVEIANGTSSLHSNGETTTSSSETTDSIPLRSSSLQPNEIGILSSSTHAGSSTFVITTEYTSTPQFTSSSDDVTSITMMNNEDVSSSSTITSPIFSNGHSVLPVDDRTTAFSPVMTPRPLTLAVPQSTIPLWMATATVPSFHAKHAEEHGNGGNEDEIISGSEEQDKSNKGTNNLSQTTVTNAGGQQSSAVSWIVAAVAVLVFLLMLLATTVLVLRYVKQSRKLHGKYNPAREEHALSAAYSMPMSHISKEERLI